MILTNITSGVDQLLIRLWVVSPDGFISWDCYRWVLGDTYLSLRFMQWIVNILCTNDPSYLFNRVCM